MKKHPITDCWVNFSAKYWICIELYINKGSISCWHWIMYCNSEWLWMENGTQMRDLSGLFTCRIVAIAYLQTASRIWRYVRANPLRDEQTGLTGILPFRATDCQPSTNPEHWNYSLRRNSSYIWNAFHEGMAKEKLSCHAEIFIWSLQLLFLTSFNLISTGVVLLRLAIRNCLKYLVDIVVW